MAFTQPTDTVQAILNHQGRDLLARMVMGHVAVQLVGFQVGREGYDGGNPVKIVPVDPAATALLDPVWPVSLPGTAPLLAVEAPYPNVLAAVCRIDRGDCLFGLGELGVWVRVLRNRTVARLIVPFAPSSLDLTSRLAGTAGNLTTITLAVAGINTPLTVVTTGQSIVVAVATDGAGSPVSTVQQVATAISLDIAANDLVGVDVTGDPTTVVSAVSSTPLAGGGVVMAPQYTEGSDYMVGAAHFPLLGKTDRNVLVFRLVLAV